MDKVEDKIEEKIEEKKEKFIDIGMWIRIYINEVFQAFVSILIIRMALEKEIVMIKIFKASIVLGFITFILENYDKDFNTSIKQGITFSVGSHMVSTYMN
jgi:hypothetical protein